MIRFAASLLLLFFFSLSVKAQTAAPPPPPPPPLTPEQNAWAADTAKPCYKDPDMPAFNIRLMDSSTIFNTFNIPEGKLFAVVFFDPNCKHCKRSIAQLLGAMETVDHIQFYFITPTHMMSDLRKFYSDNNMASYKNIVLAGRDYEFFFFNHYRTINVPDVALYDKHKKIVKLIEGEFGPAEILKYMPK